MSETKTLIEFVPSTSQHEKNLRILGLIRDDRGWALSRILLAERLEIAARHIIEASPGTPDSVKQYLTEALRGF